MNNPETTFRIGDRLYFDPPPSGVHEPFWVTIMDVTLHPQYGVGYLCEDSDGESRYFTTDNLREPGVILKHEPSTVKGGA